jgi:opacity protein-like surface antigen
MKQQFLAVVLLAGVSGMASAAAPEEGWFTGVSYGVTKIGGSPFNSTTDQVSSDAKDSSVQLWGGYRLADWVSMEGRYSTLGEYTSIVDDGSAEGKENKSEAAALSAHMKLIWPFGESGFDVYGQLGVGIVKWDSDLTLTEFEGLPPNNGQSSFSVSGTEPVVSYGIGVRWTVIPRLTLQLAADAYQFRGTGAISYPSSNVTTTQKITFDVDLLATSLGLQYNF